MLAPDLKTTVTALAELLSAEAEIAARVKAMRSGVAPLLDGATRSTPAMAALAAAAGNVRTWSEGPGAGLGRAILGFGGEFRMASAMLGALADPAGQPALAPKARAMALIRGLTEAIAARVPELVGQGRRLGHFLLLLRTDLNNLASLDATIDARRRGAPRRVKAPEEEIRAAAELATCALARREIEAALGACNVAARAAARLLRNLASFAARIEAARRALAAAGEDELPVVLGRLRLAETGRVWDSLGRSVGALLDGRAAAAPDFAPDDTADRIAQAPAEAMRGA